MEGICETKMTNININKKDKMIGDMFIKAPMQISNLFPFG